MKLPARPHPPEKITDYDDGDPYSCIAAGHAEEQMQKRLQSQVLACWGAPPEALQPLVSQDQASVKTALYDIWLENRKKRDSASLSAWAAEQMRILGNPALEQFDQAHPAS